MRRASVYVRTGCTYYNLSAPIAKSIVYEDRRKKKELHSKRTQGLYLTNGTFLLRFRRGKMES